jgi:hypothetical protein
VHVDKKVLSHELRPTRNLDKQGNQSTRSPVHEIHPVFGMVKKVEIL